jgi:hypothetical protein
MPCVTVQIVTPPTTPPQPPTTPPTSPTKFTIKLIPSDQHWVRLGNSKYAVELADRWEARTPYADRTAPRPYIDIKIPELQGSRGGKIKIRWYSNDWHYIGLSKSSDGVNFKEVWGRAAHYTFDEAYSIDLDPNCIYYRIHFEDGNLDSEVTGVYKDVEVEIYPPQPTQPPQVTITGLQVIDKTTNSAVTSVNQNDPVTKYALRVSYSSTGNGKGNLTVTVGGSVAIKTPAVIVAGSGYWNIDFSIFTSGTIYDMMMQYYRNVVNQMSICADIGDVTAQ